MIEKHVLIVLVGLGVAAFSLSVQAAAPVRAEGSGSAYLFLAEAAKEFAALRPGAVEVSVGLADAPAAFAKLCRGELDIVAATRPIAKPEMAACQASGQTFVEAAVALDAVVLVVNPRNRFMQSVTLEELRRLWGQGGEGKLLRWRQINPSWPDTPLKLFGSNPGGAEAAFFNTAVLGRGQRSRADYLASVDENVLIQGLVRDPDALAYIAYPYFAANRTKLRAVPITDAHVGAPTLDAVASGLYRPLTRALLLYVRSQALERTELSAFTEYLLTNGAELAQATDTVPLSAAAYRRGLERVKARQAGSAFGGEIPLELRPEALN